MKLLTSIPPAELPAEALLSRLRYRRSVIDLAAGKPAEVSVADSFRWVYQRLGRRLRKRLEPFFELFAMRNLVLALRYSLAGETPPTALLKSGLLAPPLQRLATATGDAEAAVAGLEKALVGNYPFIAGLAGRYRSQGPGGVERHLADGFLQYAAARATNAELRATLCYLVDMRNCLMIHKLWRWQVSQSPALTGGGSLPVALLQRIWASRDGERLARLAQKRAGEPVAGSGPRAMEQCLLKGMSRLLRRAGRDPLGLGLVIEYLLLAQLAAHNQALRQTLGEERGGLLEEVLLL